MEHIIRLIESRRLTPYQISKDTGISEAALSRIINGHTKKLNNKTADALAAYFGVDKIWLLSGDHSVKQSGDGVNINGDNTGSIVNDHRQYNSDSPDVLRQDISRLETIISEKERRIQEKDEQIAKKDEQIAKKDEQIAKKDEQIDALLDILKKK